MSAGASPPAAASWVSRSTRWRARSASGRAPARRTTGPQLIGLADTLGVGVSYFFGGLAEPPKSPAAERAGDGETAARPGFGRSLALGSFVVAFGGSAAAQVKRIAIARSRSLAFLP